MKSGSNKKVKLFNDQTCSDLLSIFKTCSGVIWRGPQTARSLHLVIKFFVLLLLFCLQTGVSDSNISKTFHRLRK